MWKPCVPPKSTVPLSTCGYASPPSTLSPAKCGFGPCPHLWISCARTATPPHPVNLLPACSAIVGVGGGAHPRYPHLLGFCDCALCHFHIGRGDLPRKPFPRMCCRLDICFLGCGSQSLANPLMDRFRIPECCELAFATEDVKNPHCSFGVFGTSAQEIT